MLELEAHSRAWCMAVEGAPGLCAVGGSQKLGGFKNARHLHQMGLKMRRDQTSNSKGEDGIWRQTVLPGLGPDSIIITTAS